MSPAAGVRRPVSENLRGAAVGTGVRGDEEVEPAGERKLRLPRPQRQGTRRKPAVQGLPLAGPCRAGPFIDEDLAAPSEEDEREIRATAAAGACVAVRVNEELNGFRSDKALAVRQRELEHELAVILRRHPHARDVRPVPGIARRVVERRRVGRRRSCGDRDGQECTQREQECRHRQSCPRSPHFPLAAIVPSRTRACRIRYEPFHNTRSETFQWGAKLSVNTRREKRASFSWPGGFWRKRL